MEGMLSVQRGAHFLRSVMNIHRVAMHRNICLLFVLGLVLGISGCTYRGRIRDQVYIPRTAALEAPKIQRRLLLFQEGHTSANQLKVSGGGHTIIVKLQPGLMNAIQAELSGSFQKVFVITSPGMAKKDDLIATVSFDVHELSRDVWKGHYQFDTTLTLTIQE